MPVEAPGPDDDGEATAAVRPLGFVSDEPIVRRVGDRDIYLGNAVAARPGEHDHTFEAVVSLTEEAHPLTTDHHPLTDGPGNRWSDFAAAVDTTRERLRADGSVLVHCKAGVSRSTTVLATALAAEEGPELAAAVEAVRATRPIATPHPALYELAVCYLAARDELDGR